MKVIHTVKELRESVLNEKQKGHCVALVPTMGFLHEGHASLIRRARKENDFVVVSIFLNPTQFGPTEDLEAYPRDPERDKVLCTQEGADVVFMPEVSEMYPEGYSTYVTCEGGITEKLCGASRPGHFKGVTSVVTKLFNMVGPDRAYFGQKDAQQVAVIEKMVRDLNMPVEIVPCPIVREADGLALSSRNTYLSEKERKEALVLSQSLEKAKQMLYDGERNAETIIAEMRKHIETADDAEIDYIEIVNSQNLERVHTCEGDLLIALAVKIGKPRLIDNCRLTV